MKFVKSVMVTGLSDQIDLKIKILILPTYVIHVVDLVIRGKVMHEKAEKELLIKCVQRPSYAAERLQSQFGYTMNELQEIKNRAALLQTRK